MLRFLVCFIVLLLELLLGTQITPSLASSIYSIQTRVSTGYRQKINHEKRFTAFLDWTLRHSDMDRMEAVVDLGLNNEFVQNHWGFYPYQAYLTYSLTGSESKIPIYDRSRIQLGRQLLVEGFELAPLDGAQIPLYWSKTGGLHLSGGGLHSLEERQINFDSILAGVSAFETILDTQLRVGYIYKRKSSEDANLIHGAIQKDLPMLPWSPSIFLKAQGRADDNTFQQGVSELSFFPSNSLGVSMSYSSRRYPDLYPGERDFIYELFSISPTKSLRSSAYLNLNSDIRIQTSLQKFTFDSLSGKEDGYEAELSPSFHWNQFSFIPSFQYLYSYGGRLYSFGVKLIQRFAQELSLKSEASAVKLSKINGIENWAYHTRSGLEYQLNSKLFGAILMELERNQYFKIDARAVVYVSHFYY